VSKAPAKERARPRPEIKPAFLGPDDAAALLGISRTRVYELIASDRFPAPAFAVRKRKRWDRQELLEWGRAGAPSRDRWDIIRGRQ